MNIGDVMRQNAAHWPDPAGRPGRVFGVAGFAARRAGKSYPDGLSFVVKPVMAALTAQARRCSIVTQGVEQ